MRPIVKKVLAAVAVKEGVERIMGSRKPKRSAWAKITPVLIVAGAAGAVAFLAKTGKLQPAVEKAKSITGGEDRVTPAEQKTEARGEAVNV